MRKPIEEQRRGHGTVAWLLLTIALGTFTPCVLLPEWRAYQAIRVAEQAEQHRVESLRRLVERERRLLDAIQTDPEVTARLAQRELGFRRVGERAVRIDVHPGQIKGDVGFVPTHVPPPPALSRLASHLPDYDYDAVFCDDECRPVIIAMSVGLMFFAVCLPRPRVTPVEA